MYKYMFMWGGKLQDAYESGTQTSDNENITEKKSVNNNPHFATPTQSIIYSGNWNCKPQKTSFGSKYKLGPNKNKCLDHLCNNVFTSHLKVHYYEMLLKKCQTIDVNTLC